ncbi:MAG: MotA/TolQ/ExbB proton channel family protein [Planctomycetota bacterium]
MLEFFARGGPLMWPLLAVSLVAVTFLLYKAIFWLRVRAGRDGDLAVRFLKLVEEGKYAEAAGGARGSKDFVVRILHCGLVHRNYSASEALKMAADDTLARMRRYQTVLDTVVTVAPLLGILGTVLGIIDSFNLLGDAAAADPRAATQGVARALITTAAGLSIAIPTLIFSNYFGRLSEHAAAEIETEATCLEICLARNEAHGVGEAAEEEKTPSGSQPPPVRKPGEGEA